MSSTRQTTTRSTSGSGFDFEDQIAAWLLVKMLTGEAMPDMGGRLGRRLQFQTSALNWLVDDLLVTCEPNPETCHLALSCKSNVQVTSAGLPSDFVEAAWKHFMGIEGARPLRRGSDRIALVTSGRHSTFQPVWTQIKDVCTSSDPKLALARIRGVNNQRTLLENTRRVVEEVSPTVRDKEILEFVQHLNVIPTDFHLNPSDDRELAISRCRSILVSAAPDEARELWDFLVERGNKARIGDGTIDLLQLWDELRNRFRLTDHPDFSSGWDLLRAYTQDHLDKIEVALPTDHSLARSEDKNKLAQAMADNPIVVLYGDSGTGKSALAKSMMNEQSGEASYAWLAPDALSLTLNETERRKSDLTYPLHLTLKAAAQSQNVLVIDAAERIDRELVPKVRQLIETLLPENEIGEIPVWRVLAIGQTEAWVDGRLQELTGNRQPASVEIGPVSIAEVREVLRSIPKLTWLASQDEALNELTNLRALAWVMQAEAHFQEGHILSLTAIVDSIWKYWTGEELPLQSMLMQLAKREASFERSIGISELETPQAQLIQKRPPQLPLRVTPQHRIEFKHDLAADWSRFQYLKEISDDPSKWADLAQNPLWTNALRMLGQLLLRVAIGGRTAWDVAFEKLNVSDQNKRSAADILLDALCLDPNAESLLAERADLLFANNGALLDRLLSRFLHIATVPSSQRTSSLDPSLGLYMEAQNRLPIITRWPPVIRFLSACRERVAPTVSPVVAKLCERWLRTVPAAYGADKPTPFRRHLAEIALSSGRALQLARGKGVIFHGDDVEKAIYSAALTGAVDLPEEVCEWALEMAQRRPWRSDIVAHIAKFHQQEAREHEARLRNDLKYRERHQRKEQMVTPGAYIKELPPWPHGPQRQVESSFRYSCIHAHSLIPMMKVRPEVATEVLFALVIEDNPVDEHDQPNLESSYGLQSDHESHPTIYWKSPFYSFLLLAPSTALDAVIDLAVFCTDRWEDERQRHGADRSSVVIELQTGTQKKFVGNRSVFNWSQDNSTMAGQLHCALAALEKWLCDCLDNGTDISPYIQRLLEKSHSVATLGVLTSIGKYRPVLFKGLLRPLLTHQALYFWDKHRCDVLELGFAAIIWARQGQTVFEMAQKWWFASHRRTELRSIIVDLVRSDAEISEYLTDIAEGWELPENRKSALEVRMLQAELDHTNYSKEPDSDRTLFEYPESVQRDVTKYQEETGPVLQALMLPHNCEQLLSKGANLTEEQRRYLADFLDAEFPGENATVTQSDWRLARIAAASTLLAQPRSWLNANPDIYSQVKAIVWDVVEQIGDDGEILRRRMITDHRDLVFVAHAILREFVGAPNSVEAGNAVLRVLTSGGSSAVGILTSLGYARRDQLGGAWWRLLEICLLWCALAVLLPRPDQPETLHKLWARWLGWLRTRDLTDASSWSRLRPLDVARRVERLERRRWVREAEREWRFGIDPNRRWSPGLDAQFLQETFVWLLQTVPDDTHGSDSEDIQHRFALLKRLLDFELWRHRPRDDDRDEPPSEIGYAIVPAIVDMIPRLPRDTAAELWQPLFRLGGRAHYIVGNFIDAWLHRNCQNCGIEVFSQHWRTMIEYALASSEWSHGRRWFKGEELLRRLLGYGSEAFLNRVPGLQTTVLDMKDLYQIWAETYLERDEDHIAYFCNFLSSSTGCLLRCDGLQWLRRSIEQEESVEWRRPYASECMTDLLNVMLTEDIDEITANASVRDALLDLVAILVQQQATASLELQERARTKLGSSRSSSSS